MTRHYEQLIQSLDASLVQNDFSSNTAATLSLHRLAQSLRTLLRSLWADFVSKCFFSISFVVRVPRRTSAPGWSCS